MVKVHAFHSSGSSPVLESAAATTLPRPTRLVHEDTAASIASKTISTPPCRRVSASSLLITPFFDEHCAYARRHGQKGQQGGEGRKGRKERRETRSALETKLLNDEVLETGVLHRAAPARHA